MISACRRTASVYYLGRQGSGRESKDANGGGGEARRGEDTASGNAAGDSTGRKSFTALLRTAVGRDGSELSTSSEQRKRLGARAGVRSLGDADENESRVVRSRHEDQMRLGLSKNTRGNDLHLSRQYAGGHVATDGVLIKLLSSAYYNPRFTQIIQMLARPSTFSPRLHVKPVLHELRGQTFGNVFVAMLRNQSMLAIGLYRTQTDEKGQAIEYVYTKPSSETKVRKEDLVFALGYADLTADEQLPETATGTSAADEGAQ